MEHIMWRFRKYEQNMFGEKCVRSSRLTPILWWYIMIKPLRVWSQGFIPLGVLNHRLCFSPKHVFLFSLNFPNAASQRPLDLPWCSCIITVYLHWNCAPDICFMSLTYFFRILTKLTKHTFLIVTWIIFLWFPWCWVFWIHCRWDTFL